ncbi:PQQ-binding-like beta-propeller repeat protein [Caulobacter sp. 17J65-9]|uniref:PQQ-binding-like beta-propeller repeat protein n=1 Tax=Caulobacter sp. 17J65-9 TaxID=2709382 RepID=UPI0013CBC3BF|nr:PQQ-binding-like beta-propeller repeat protein [Caulobacter sp. 17J65-9]NEX91285.1 PQQ-binding-like beta-propeller repeat protein [Caulobacter sp. 17J65-9]
MNQKLKVAAVALACCAGLSACATVSKLNPFDKKEGSKTTAAKGERIPVIGFERQLQVSDTLAGQTFYIPEAQPVTAWPLPGGNEAQAVENVAAAPAFEIAWKHGVGEGSSRKGQVTAPPVAVDGRIFTMDAHATVTATDAAGGGQAWRADLERREGKDKEAFGGGLAVANGKVFVSSGYRFMAAVDSATGKVLWKTDVESPIHAAPTVSGSRVYVVDVDNQILAFDINTGEIAWSYQAIVEPARIMKASSPAVQGDAVITPFSSGELVALRAANGNALWSEVLSRTSRTNALSEIRDIAGRPAIYKGDVYAASHSGVFAAVDARTGARKWDLPVASVNAPVPAGDVVYIVDQAGELIAANRENGQVYWIKDLNKGRVRNEGGFLGVLDVQTRPIWSGPLLASGRLVLVNNWGEAVAIDALTGEIQKTLKIGAASYLSPIAYGDKIYVVTDKADLIAIR